MTAEALSQSLILTGFTGTGKTTVGRLVAQRLGRPFVDLDAHIEARAGRSVRDLFREGEHHLRAWERRALADLELAEPLVLATGGGALVGAGNQRLVAGLPVIVLDAPLAEVEARLGNAPDRPIRARLADRYARRAAAYARLPLHVATAGRAPDAIADEVIALAAQVPSVPPPAPGHTLPVRVPGGHRYNIRIGAGGAAEIGALVAGFEPGAVALVTDESVGRLWGETVRHDLLAAGLPTALIEIPAGEAHKTLETVQTVYDRLLDAGIDRSGAVVALGGGVVGDLAGFAAATWMRGVRTVVQVPTTVLAMVDASVGGKTGVDHPRGKNLVGAFRHPDLVLVDSTFLQTLPAREWRSGLAEVVKHGIIGDPGLFEAISGGAVAVGGSEAGSQAQLFPHSLDPLLARAVRVKVEIVQRDPEERGERATLNLGHTFGHAYEWLSDYTLAHGEAVSVGLVTAARLSEALGLATPGLAARVEATLAGLGLPVRWPGGADGAAVWAAMQRDKKRAASGLRFVLPRALGDVIVTEPGHVPRATVLDVLAAQHGG